MSKVLPMFASAPRCEVRINDIPIAYAIGLSLNVSVDVIPIKVLGQFKVKSLEPTMYNPVTGTFRVIRLTSKDLMSKHKTLAAQNKADIVGASTTIKASVEDSDLSSGHSVLGQDYLHRHLDPERVLLSQTFDLNIYMKTPVFETQNGVVFSEGPAVDSKGAPILGQSTDLVATQFMTIQDCRIVSMDGEIAPGRLLEEPLAFQGLLVINSALADALQERLDSTIKDTSA